MHGDGRAVGAVAEEAGSAPRRASRRGTSRPGFPKEAPHSDLKGEAHRQANGRAE